MKKENKPWDTQNCPVPAALPEDHWVRPCFQHRWHLIAPNCHLNHHKTCSLEYTSSVEIRILYENQLTITDQMKAMLSTSLVKLTCLRKLMSLSSLFPCVL